MASNKPGRCCALGHLHEGTPSGEHIKIGKDGGIDAYLATPKTAADASGGKTLILYLPDVRGIWQNSQLMADGFAAEGLPCLVVDLFNGDPAPANPPAGWDIMAWLAQGSDGRNPHGVEQVDAITGEALAWARAQGYDKVGAAGYCFGAKYAVRHLRSGGGVAAAYLAHPSFVDDDELAAVAGPLAIAAAETDDIFPADKRHRSEAILAKTGVPWQIVLHSGVEHGFSVRGDISQPHIRFAKEQAFRQAVDWFQAKLVDA